MTTPTRFRRRRRGPEAGEVILYGAGGVGRDVCRVLTERASVCCASSTAAQRETRTFQGVPIRSMDACPIAPSAARQIPVVLSIFNRGVDIPAVAATLRAAGVHARSCRSSGCTRPSPMPLGDRFWLSRSP